MTVSAWGPDGRTVEVRPGLLHVNQVIGGGYEEDFEPSYADYIEAETVCLNPRSFRRSYVELCQRFLNQWR